MLYRRLPRAGVELSVIGLGGHEFLPDGRSRGFNENHAAAITPGHFFEGFGGEKRLSLLGAALDAGINLFDATIDSEKEALGRNLRRLRLPQEIYIQTRPEGMGYSYDPNNRKMADYALLKDEVQRALRLLQRDHIDFYNFPFLQGALDHDPEYLPKIADNIARLKCEGLIRFAVADTFSGEATYLRQIENGCFDSLFINFNVADDGAVRRVLPAAVERGMGVHAREAFIKGALFRMAEEAGHTDRDSVARAAIKWVLAQQVTTLVMGVETADALRRNLAALASPALTDAEDALLADIRATEMFARVHAQKAAVWPAE